MPKKQLIIPVVVLILALSLSAFGLYQLNKIPAPKFPEISTKFSLMSDHGRVSSDEMKGKVGLIFFGYTHCPDVCPTTMLTVSSTLNKLSDAERTKVRSYFISIDPERDSPKQASEFAHHFSPDLIGLSGSTEEVTAAAEAFKVGYEKDKPNKKGNYDIAHSTYIFLVRPDGELGDLIGHADSPDDIAEKVRYWLKWAD